MSRVCGPTTVARFTVDWNEPSDRLEHDEPDGRRPADVDARRRIWTRYRSATDFIDPCRVDDRTTDGQDESMSPTVRRAQRPYLARVHKQ